MKLIKRTAIQYALYRLCYTMKTPSNQCDMCRGAAHFIVHVIFLLCRRERPLGNFGRGMQSAGGSTRPGTCV